MADDSDLFSPYPQLWGYLLLSQSSDSVGEPLGNHINQEGNQWNYSLFSLKELLEGQTTVYFP